MLSTIRRIFLALAVALLAFPSPRTVEACPFCPTLNTQTLAQQVEGADAAVLAELIDVPTKFDDESEVPTFDEAIEASKAIYRIDEIFHGESELGEEREIRALYLSEKEPGAKFLILARKQPELEWRAPIWLSERAVEYLKDVLKLPTEEGREHERLIFFEDYLQDEESLLRANAFDEFARADYEVVKKVKDHLDRPRLLRWIADPEVTRTHRRLYLTLLGVCGQAEDVKLLEHMLRNKEETDWLSLDALVACYLTLTGEEGLPLIEELFLKNGDEVDYGTVFGVTMALRFHGEQGDPIPRKRVIESMRYVLERDDLADLATADLARWEDWDSIDRLAQLFHDVGKDLFFIRLAVVKYMRVCPLPKAKEYLAEFAEVDPKVVRRATMTWPGLSSVNPQKSVAANKTPADAKAAADEPASADPEQAVAGASPAEKSAAGEDPAAGDGGIAEATSDEPGPAVEAKEGERATVVKATPAAAKATAEPKSILPERIMILGSVALGVLLLLIVFRLILRTRGEPIT